jgi:hypothetical protein
MATWKVQQLTGALQGQTGWPATGGVKSGSEPAVVQYKNQMHVFYVGLVEGGNPRSDAGDGQVWDVWYDGHTWNLQLLIGEETVVNGNSYSPLVSNGQPAAPFENLRVVVYDNNDSPQIHVCYVGLLDENIWDVWYDGHNWQLQPLNKGAPPAGPPAVVQFKDQMHVWYRGQADASAQNAPLGVLWDVWYDGHNWQTQNAWELDFLLSPQAAGDPAVVVYDNNNTPQIHVSYRAGAGATDINIGNPNEPGQIYDIWYPGQQPTQGGPWYWNVQQLTGETQGDSHYWNAPRTAAPAAPGNPALVVYDNNNNPQMHVCYRVDEPLGGVIWDLWYDGHQWAAQLLTSGQNGSTTIDGFTSKKSAPPTAGDPAAVQYKNQMHVCYTSMESREELDPGGLIWDVWYDGHNWQLQLLTGGPGTYGNDVALTSGPSALGNPVPAVYDNNNSPQMHVCYIDINNNIQDCWYGPD